MVIRRVHPRWLALAAGTVGMAATLALAGPAFAARDYVGVLPQKVTEAPKVVTTTCAACHGAKGIAVAPTFPNLAGQNYGYLLKSLEDFRSGKWQATPMSAMVNVIPRGTDHENLKKIAAYFAGLPLTATGTTVPKPTEAVAKRGYTLYFEGDPASQTPACAACHSSSGLGDAPMAVPRLAGQNAMYVLSQLQAFSKDERPSPDKVMEKVAKTLSPADMQAVASYVSVMQPDLLPGVGPTNFKAYAKARESQPVPGIPASAPSSSQP
ncbi:MAG TPA: c-type cytochrome [Nevskiaceae bacterium]